MNQSPLCVIQGPTTTTTPIPANPPQTTAFIQPPSDVHIRLNIHRTANAIANGYFCIPFSDSGLIDQNSCSYTIGEADGIVYTRGPDYGGGTSMAMPLVIMEGPTNSQAIGAGVPFGALVLPVTTATYAAKISNPRHVLRNDGTPGTIPVTIAAPFTSPGGYANGQETELYSSGGGTTWTFARNGAGLRLNADCALTAGEDVLRLKYHSSTGLWHELGRGVYAP